MRDLSRVGSSGTGKSRGYAFINFTQHTDALHALRATNNKPEIFGDNKVGNMYVDNTDTILVNTIRVLIVFKHIKLCLMCIFAISALTVVGRQRTR